MCLSRDDKPLMGSLRAYMGRSAVLVGLLTSGLMPNELSDQDV